MPGTANGTPSKATATLTALLADDEALATDELSFLLKDFPVVEIAGAATNGPEAVQKILDLEPDLVFLDVQMPGLDGMGVIRRIRELSRTDAFEPPYFILVTAYDQYAIEAFRLEALDYLLKPIEPERLREAVDRAQRSILDRPAPAEDLESTAAKPALQRTKVLVRNASHNYIVDALDIVYATIDDGLITIVTTQFEGISNYRTIEELQSNLDPELFWRVHRSYLVNINRIKEVVPWFKSSFQLRMDDKKGAEIPVSRVQTKRLRTLLKL
jgi:two-component system LytT family response regulator/two-component system response regulator LytT